MCKKIYQKQILPCPTVLVTSIILFLCVCFVGLSYVKFICIVNSIKLSRGALFGLKANAAIHIVHKKNTSHVVNNKK